MAGSPPLPDPLPQGEREKRAGGWEARKLLRAARVGTLASSVGRAAVRVAGHAGLRA